MNPFEQAVQGGKSPPSAIGMTKSHEMTSSGRMFLKSPKDRLEAIISSQIPDRTAVTAIAAYIENCKEFEETKSPEGEEMAWLDNHLAGWRGINGAALVLALETEVEAISEITTTAVLGLAGSRDLAKRVKEHQDKDQKKVDKGKVQD